MFHNWCGNHNRSFSWNLSRGSLIPSTFLSSTIAYTGNVSVNEKNIFFYIFWHSFDTKSFSGLRTQGEISSSSVSTSIRIIINQIKLHHSKVNMGFDSYLFEITKETSYTTILVYSVAVSAGSLVLYAYSVFQLWEKDFSGNRLDRSSISSPSNKQPPKVERWV